MFCYLEFFGHILEEMSKRVCSEMQRGEKNVEILVRVVKEVVADNVLMECFSYGSILL